MQQIERVQASDLDAEGKLRRRFEIDEPENKALGTKVTTALLLGNAFLILKSVLFPSSSPNAKTAGRPVEDGPQFVSVESDEQDKSSAETEGLPKQNEIDFEEFLVDELELNLAGPVSSGTAARTFQGGDTFGVSIPGVTSTTPMPLLGASAGQIGSNVVNFPTLDVVSPGQVSGSSGASGARGSGNSVPGPINPDSMQGSDPDSDMAGNNNDNPAPQMNRLPVVLGSATLPGALVNQSMLIGLLSLVQGAHDPDGDELEVSNLTSSSGIVTANADATWTFTPEAYSVGEVIFTYQIGDGEGHVIQTATLNIAPIPGEEILGTDASEVILGTPGKDNIVAGDGDDTIVAREDDDFVDAGSGNDRIITGQGDDVIYAGLGDDIVFAGDGDDIVFGGEGNDVILGEAGDDTLLGEEGDDFILAGTGDDRTFGGDGNDLIRGEEGNDLLDGGAGIDEIFAGVGDDVIVAGSGDDVANGDEGNDIFVASVNDGNDRFDGGSGVDTVSFAGTSASVEINLGTGTAIGEQTGTDQLFNMENVVGGAGDDIITGNEQNNELQGGDGNDTFVATLADGDDIFDGGDGVDTISFAFSDTETHIDLAGGTVQSSATGNDLIANIENVVGSLGNDIITMSNALNIVSGGGGNDTFVFDSANSSGQGRGNRDIIEDFDIGDVLDFTGFVGNPETNGWERLTFIYDQAEFSSSGQIRYRYETFEDQKLTIVEIKADLESADGETDFDIDIELIGHHQLNFENLFT